MPNLSYDGQSFLIDARRFWLTSASLAYTQIARQDWADRIAAVHQAGMNCIEVIVPWRIHEPTQGKFHFSGQANLRKFTQLIIAQGMYVILRPGPYIANQDDLGSMPAWLLALPDIQLRQASPEFLQASARYLGKVMAQVHDLQITSPRLDDAPEAGRSDASEDADETTQTTKHPIGIIMIQAEHQWLCHHPDQSDKYLKQIVRYLRENNCQVPISLSNNLWQQVDGTLDTWYASEHLASDLRQLRMIQPNSPRFVSHLSPAQDANIITTQLAGTLAVGGQFNLDPFCSPSLPQAHSGRTLTPHAPGSQSTPTPETFAITSTGSRSATYFAIKRIATLASQFGHVLAHAQPAAQPAAVSPDFTNDPNALAVLEQRGTQGSLVFILKSPASKTTHANILLPDGQTLPVPLGTDPVSWIGLDINLSGIAQLTLTNLRPWAWLNKQMLVLFGPAQAQGLVVIDGASHTFNVPSHKQPPAILHHDDITIVILNDKQIDTAYPTPHGLIVGTHTLDENHQPMSTDFDAKNQPVLITHAGTMSRLQRSKKTDEKASTKLPSLSAWQRLSTDDLLNGRSDSYVQIDQPQSMEAIGIDSPYCWYRLILKSPVASIPTLASPASGGSLQFFANSKYTGTLKAQQTAKIKLARETVILASNPGRFADGWRMHEQTGLSGDLFAIKPIKLPKPKIASQVLDSPLKFRAYLQDIRHEHREMTQTLTWSLTLRSKAARIFVWENFPLRSMLLVNGQIAGVYDPALSDHAQQVLLQMDDLLRSGKNELTLAILEPIETLKAADAAPLIKQVKLYEASRTFTEKAELSYAKWKLPDAAMFDDKKSAAAKAKASAQGPCWHRTTFDIKATSTNLMLDIKGLKQGQVHVNHHHAANITHEQNEHTIALPSSWLHTDKSNEILIFDVQGSSVISANIRCV